MKRTFLYALLLLPALAFLSCEVEEFGSEKADPDNLTADAPLTQLLRRVASSDAVPDHAVDSAACFRIVRPYQVVVHDLMGGVDYAQTHTVSNDVSQEVVNSTIASLQFSQGDWFEPVFPLTIAFADGTQQTITGAAQWQAIRSACTLAQGNTDPIACADIHYPITVFGYDTNSQSPNTYVINDDAALYALLMSLQPGQLLALDYPIGLTFSDGSTLTVQNNTELLNALNQAISMCSEADPCGNNVLTDGLLIYVPFGNEAKDLVSGYHLSYNAAFPPALVTDRSGNANGAVSFSGDADDFLWLSETVQNHIGQGDSLTISLWFRMQNTDAGNLERFFEKSEGGNTAFFLGAYDMNRPLFFSNIGGVQSLWDLTWNNEALWNDTTNWHHLALTIEGDTNTVKLYRDGQLVGTDADSDFNLTSETFAYYLGKGFKGHLDDLRVYGHTLTAAQLAQLAQLPGDVHTCLN